MTEAEEQRKRAELLKAFHDCITPEDLQRIRETLLDLTTSNDLFVRTKACKLLARHLPLVPMEEIEAELKRRAKIND